MYDKKSVFFAFLNQKYQLLHIGLGIGPMLGAISKNRHNWVFIFGYTSFKTILSLDLKGDQFHITIGTLS